MNNKRDKIKDAGYEKHYVYNAHYHLIWCTKYRNPIFTNQDLAQEMQELLKQVAADNQIKIEKMEIMPEHIHLLISFRPSKSGSSVVKALKGRSAFYSSRIIPKSNKARCGAVIYGHQVIILAV